MDKVINFVKKANQLLFFIAATIFIVLISIEIFSKLFRNQFEPAKIELVDDSAPKDELRKPVYTISFLTRLKNVHIFELTSKVVDTNKYHTNQTFNMFAAPKVSHDFSSSMYLSENAVNLMFVKENGQRRMLFDKDGFIKEFTKAKESPNEHSYKLDKNLYLVVDEDTNENGYFDQNDAANLYTSTYDGKNLSLVLADVGSYELIDNNRLIISQKGKSPSFFTYKVTESSLLKLNTEIKISKEK